MKKESHAVSLTLSDREVLLVGAVNYWAEGSKSKPWRPNDFRMLFINSDPVLVLLFLRFLEIQGVDRASLSYRLSIHESADVPAAERFWAEIVGVDVTHFNRTSLKRHRPKTIRKNTGEQHRGCLAVYVTRSADLYRRMEGAWYGIVVGARSAD